MILFQSALLQGHMCLFNLLSEFEKKRHILLWASVVISIMTSVQNSDCSSQYWCHYYGRREDWLHTWVGNPPSQ